MRLIFQERWEEKLVDSLKGLISSPKSLSSKISQKFA
jgi:hypothetical protein